MTEEYPGQLKDLEDFIIQLKRLKFQDSCNALIQSAQTTASKIAVLEKLRGEMNGN